MPQHDFATRRRRLDGIDQQAEQRLLHQLGIQLDHTAFAPADAPQPDADRIEAELGDLLFVCVNVARHAGVDVSRALRRTNAKFERRFAGVERRAREAGVALQDAGLARMTEWYTAQKAEDGEA